MRHCQDQNELAFDRVQNAVRKDTSEASPNILIGRSPSERIACDSLERFCNRIDKSISESRLTCFVIPGGTRQFCERTRVKLALHRLSVSRACRIASSAGIVDTLPTLVSSRRRFASVSHSLSILLSCAASRLSTSMSANSALPSAGSSIAFRASSSGVTGMGRTISPRVCVSSE
jgi:hypothetical protein